MAGVWNIALERFEMIPRGCLHRCKRAGNPTFFHPAIIAGVRIVASAKMSKSELVGVKFPTAEELTAAKPER
jgi:hypothetical protein